MLEIPSSSSKRRMYQRFYGERGWEVKTTARGTTKTTRKAGQELTSKLICHWATFQRFWKREYPLLRLPKPAADICSDCHVYHNRFRYTTRQQAASNATSENPNAYFNAALDLCVVIAPVNEDDTGLDNVTGLLTNLNLEEEPAIKERSKALEAATLHIKQAAVQRKLANTKIQEAIDDAEKSHGERRHIFIADYCQNMELPFFGASQPGDT